MDMVAFHNCHFQIIAKKPINIDYKMNPTTIGEHVRKVRIERGLYQKDVAKYIGVSDETINNWENNYSKPQISKMKAVIAFLGYIPFE